MRLMYRNADDLNIPSVAEVLHADTVRNMELLLNDEGYDEIPDLPGIHFTCAAIESLPAGECYYDVIIMLCKDAGTVNEVLHELLANGYVDSTKYISKCLLNPEPQELYDLMKSAADEWLNQA